MRIIVSPLWLVVFPLAISLHIWKVMLFVFMLLSVHEAGHILCARMLSLQSVEVRIYPMGLSARIKDLEFQKSIHEIMITVAGLSVHIVVYFLLPLLSLTSFISKEFIMYLNRINIELLLFNLLPVYPLDGGRILRNVFELFLPYRLAKKTSIAVSILIVLLLVLHGLLNYPSGMILFCFFVFQLGSACIFYQVENREFYLYRFLHGIKAKKKVHQHLDVYKNRENYVFNKGRIISEKQFLQQFF